MTKEDLFHFIRSKRLAVISTTNAAGSPEAALIGFAFDRDIGLIFDTSSTSRKARNLRARPQAALVIGWDDETTVQMEGAAAEPIGMERDQAKQIYFETWPDGRARAAWPDITYFAIQPQWLRYSQYTNPPTIVELK